MPSAGKKHNPNYAQDQVASYLIGDILSHLRLAADFADLAEKHSQIFDDNGFRYCTDRFLDHARQVSTIMKKLREVK